MSYIDDVFGPQGHLAKTFDGYVPRPGQMMMAGAVASAITDGARLLVEGPTGVGKSVAYLVPAIRAAVEDAKRVIVVTSGIALQEQLVQKDLPALQRALPFPFRFAMLKGISNYACLRDVANAPLDRDVNDVLTWLQETDTGDLSELPMELSPATRGKVTTTSEECTGKRCKDAGRCFVLRARAEAAAAQVLVVNYHLFFANLALVDAVGKGFLPESPVVLLDEAHNAPDIARDFFGFKVTLGGIRNAARRLARVAPLPAQDIERAADRFFADAERFRKSDRYRARLVEPPPLDWEPLRDALRLGAKPLIVAAQNEPDADAAQKLRAQAGTIDGYVENLQLAMTLARSTDVYYLEDLGQRGTGIAGCPLNVSEQLRNWLWGNARYHAVVAASATLTAGGSFDMVERDLGADGARKLEVESPFDWARNAVVVVPGNLPMPTEREFAGRACQALVDAISAAGGRTLALFTSRRMLEAGTLAVRAAHLPYRILVQGEAPRMQLAKEFRDDVRSVLLGMDSFAEGLDVQGEACSCVVIDRLPFDSPDDPVGSALGDKRKDHFARYALPRAVIGFRQRCGRLIRTATDRGAIVVLDRRIIDKPYGRKFMHGLPEGVRLESGPGWQDIVSKACP